MDALTAAELSAIERGQSVIARITEEAFPRGATLRCVSCAQEDVASIDEIERYLSAGWPWHCGRVMRVDAR